MDLNCVLRAHGFERNRIGEDHSERADANGKKFARELVEVARTRRQGRVDYDYLNPKSGRIEPQSTYVELAGDYVIGCGIFRPATEQTARVPAARRLPRA